MITTSYILKLQSDKDISLPNNGVALLTALVLYYSSWMKMLNCPYWSSRSKSSSVTHVPLRL
jgi:hypothetical protein